MYIFDEYPRCDECENMTAEEIEIKNLLEKEIKCECGNIIKIESYEVMLKLVRTYIEDFWGAPRGKIETLENRVRKIEELLAILFLERRE